MKNFIKKSVAFFNVHINGYKGAVSLLLILTMLPMMTAALLVVESARYQNAIQSLDEMLDCVGLSSIADYDKYIEDRFDLLAVSQKKSINTTFNDYLQRNLPALKNVYTSSTTNAEGCLPLSEHLVLKEQILDYSELSVGIETFYEGLNIDELLSKLQEAIGLGDINKYMDTASGAADLATAASDLITELKELKEKSSDYETKKSEYEQAADDFYEKSDSLISILRSKTESGVDDLYSDSEVSQKANDLKTGITTFKDKTGALSEATKTLKEKVSSCFSKLSDVTEKAGSLQRSYEQIPGTTLQDQCTTSTSEWVVIVADEATDLLNEVVDRGSYASNMDTQKSRLDDQKSKLSRIKCDGSVPGQNDYVIDASSNRNDIEQDFPKINTDAIRNNASSLIDGTVSDLDNNRSTIEENIRADIGKLLDVATELLGVQLFYDGSLDSKISSNVLFQTNPEMSLTNTLITDAITKVLDGGRGFIEALGEFNILKALKSLAEFLVGIVEFIASIVTWIGETLINLATLLTSGSEMFKTFLLSGYCIYNLPCRTTFESGKSISGYSYKKIFDMFGGTIGNRFTGCLEDLKNMADGSEDGTDLGFKGAESEYVLIGSKNELLNQSATFFNIYLFRLVLDIIPLFKNEQLSAIAGAANVASWVVWLVAILAEPMIDTIMLVNGQEENLIKETVYFSYSGNNVLMHKATNITGLSDSVKSKLSDSITAENGNADYKGFLPMNYQEHLLILLLLTASPTEMLARIQDLINMETKEYYKDDFDFSLTNTYTNIKIESNGTLNSMFDLELLTADGPFSISRKRFVGY